MWSHMFKRGFYAHAKATSPGPRNQAACSWNDAAKSNQKHSEMPNFSPKAV